MMKTFLAALTIAIGCSTASAAFNLNVTATGGGFSFPTYNNSATSVAFVDLIDGAPFSGNDLILSYSITNNPVGGFYKINNIGLIYQGAGALPGTISITISESAANMIAPGTTLNASTNFDATGTPSIAFTSSSTFDGVSTINTVPGLTFLTSPTILNYSGNSTFTTVGATGTISTTFNVNFGTVGNTTFGDINNTGVVGVIKVDIPPAPLPPSLLFGVFAAPVLGLLRRRFKK